jgi:hypothetical protein
LAETDGAVVVAQGTIGDVWFPGSKKDARIMPRN